MTTTALIELLSECAVELENFDNDNVVARRARTAIAELKNGCLYSGFDVVRARQEGYAMGHSDARREAENVLHIAIREALND